jgi:hypothetical protein
MKGSKMVFSMINRKDIKKLLPKKRRKNLHILDISHRDGIHSVEMFKQYFQFNQFSK